MSAATLRMTGKARETAVDAVALARSACDAITDLDHELAVNREAVEALRLEQIRGRREVLATGLKMLWQHHIGTGSDRCCDPGCDHTLRLIRSSNQWRSCGTRRKRSSDLCRYWDTAHCTTTSAIAIALR